MEALLEHLRGLRTLPDNPDLYLYEEHHESIPEIVRLLRNRLIHKKGDLYWPNILGLRRNGYAVLFFEDHIALQTRKGLIMFD